MATVNHAGETFTMEAFTAQTTDGSGDIVLTLANTPTSDDGIAVQLSGIAGAFAQVQTRTGTSLTVRVYQKYEKIDASPSVSDLPASVTADTTAGGPVITSNSKSGVGSETPGGGTQTLWTDTHTHTTTINKISDHSHTTTGTVLNALATTGSITITVMYAF